MKALTIWQPWASLIIAGVKPYEFRGWYPPASIIGRRIAIHAGARPVRKAEIADLILRLRSDQAWTTALRPDALALLEGWHANPSTMWLSSILGTARLDRPYRATQITGEFGAPVNDSDREKNTNWAWPMMDVQPLQPVPARGAQGFWDWAEQNGQAT